MEDSSGLARSNYLEFMVNFLNRNPELVNLVPNKFHSNPLELAINLGDQKSIQGLLSLKAQVRPENRNLLKKIEHLFPAQLRKNDEVYFKKSFQF